MTLVTNLNDTNPAAPTGKTNVKWQIDKTDGKRDASAYVDEVEEAQLTFTDITTADADDTKHGLCPKLSGDDTEFLAGDGTCHKPAISDADDVSLSGLANGDVLAWDAGTSKWTNQAGGGGGGTSDVTADTPPASAGSLDDEFNTGSSVDLGRWTWVNQGSGGNAASGAVGSGALSFVSQNSIGSDLWSLLMQSAPGTPWEVTCKCQYNGDSLSNFQYGGLIVRDSGTGKFVAFAMDNSVLNVIHWNSATAFSSSSFSSSAWPVRAGLEMYDQPFYLRIQDNGTNLIFSISHNGITFFQVFQESRTAFLASPDQIGLGSGTNMTAGHRMTLDVPWFRRTL